MTIMDDSGDDFIAWCHFHDQHPDNPASFEKYVSETTGWDGKQFSLTEDERHWIKRANETIEWLRLYQNAGQQEFLDSALRSLVGLRPLPGSLTIE